MQTCQMKPCYKIFDMNLHPTVDGTFKDYKLNIPASLNTYYNSKYFEVIGGNMVGLPEIGGYSHDKFYEMLNDQLLKPDLFCSVPYLGEVTNHQNVIYERKKTICLKVHPRFLNMSMEKINWKVAAKICKKYNIALGICTFYDKIAKPADVRNSFKKIIDELLNYKIKLIFFHSFLDQFNYFYDRYGSNSNILFDTSFSLIRCDSETVKSYCSVINANASNICFGTDFPDYNLDDHLQIVDFIQDKTSKNSMAKYLSGNALNFLGSIVNEK